jgi:hypothetical protein
VRDAPVHRPALIFPDGNPHFVSARLLRSERVRVLGPASVIGTGHEDEFVWVLDGELTLITTRAKKHCAPETARPSGVVIPMAITWLINPIRRPGRSKLAHPTRESVAPTRTST